MSTPGDSISGFARRIGLNFPTTNGAPNRQQARHEARQEAERKATVERLAAHKRLGEAWLRERFKLRDDPRGVVIPYPERERLREFIETAHPTTWIGVGEITAYADKQTLIHARTRAELTIVEGESDRWTLEMHGIPALGVPGATMTKYITAEHIVNIERIYIVREPDNAGKAFVEGVVAQILFLKFEGQVFIVDLQAACGAKDPSALHVADPEVFEAEWQRAKEVAGVFAAAGQLVKEAQRGWASIERTAAQIIASPPPPALFDIEAMLTNEDGPAILFGEPGAMKSWVGLHIAMCMATAAPVFGRFASRARNKSVYVNLDAGRNSFERRVLRMGKALTNVIVLTPDHYDADELMALFERRAGAFVTIDAFANMYHVDRSKDAAEAAREFLQGLRALYAEYGCNGIVIDHPHRAREGGPDGGDYYGSIQKLAAIRTMWQIAKYGDPKENLARITCRKVNEAEPFPAFVVRADFSDGGFTVSYDNKLSSAVAQASVQIDEPSDAERIAAALNGAPDGVARAQLQRVTGLSRERVLAAVGDPRFVALGSGPTRRYALAPIVRQANDRADDSENRATKSSDLSYGSCASLRGPNDTYGSLEPGGIVPEADDTANDSGDDEAEYI